MVSVTFEPLYLVKVVMGSQYMGMTAEASSPPKNRLLSSALARVAGRLSPKSPRSREPNVCPGLLCPGYFAIY